MNKTTSNTNQTYEHILDVGENLILRRGFTAMGLNELLTNANVPKGSFYHYFKSKEKFGEALLTRYFNYVVAEIQTVFANKEKDQRQHLIDYFSRWIDENCATASHSRCLVVKLAGEVCDLSEVMRVVLNDGISRIITQLEISIEAGIAEKSLKLSEPASQVADSLYSLWLGAALRAKVMRSNAPFMIALARTEVLLPNR